MTRKTQSHAQPTPQRKRRSPRQAGFSIIETLVALGLISGVLAITASALNASATQSLSTSRLSALDSSVLYMRADLRSTSPTLAPSAPGVERTLSGLELSEYLQTRVVGLTRASELSARVLYTLTNRGLANYKFTLCSGEVCRESSFIAPPPVSPTTSPLRLIKSVIIHSPINEVNVTLLLDWGKVSFNQDSNTWNSPSGENGLVRAAPVVAPNGMTLTPSVTASAGQVTVNYAYSEGMLNTDSPTAITVHGTTVNRRIGAGRVKTPLPPGQYTLDPDPLRGQALEADPSFSTNIQAGASTNVRFFAPQTKGTLNVVIGGLITGETPSITLNGPGGYNSTLVSDSSLTLSSGNYSAVAGALSRSGVPLNVTVSPPSVQVTANTASTLTVTYSLPPNAAQGNLRISSNVTTNGASGLRVVSSSGQTYPANFGDNLLRPGTYTLQASPFYLNSQSINQIYLPDVSSQTLRVSSNALTPVRLNYTQAGSLIHLRGTPLPVTVTRYANNGTSGGSVNLILSNTPTPLLPGLYLIRTSTRSMYVQIQSGQMTNI